MYRRVAWRLCAAAASARATPSGGAADSGATPADIGSLPPTPDAAKGAASTPLPQPKFKYGSRFLYIPYITNFYRFSTFFQADRDQIRTYFKTFVHPQTKVRVTVIGVLHEAHPMFYKQVDQLCCQHDSVLMEGRTPIAGAPHSTLVPPRKTIGQVRPDGHEDDEGWEPNTHEGFWQPFSWGVRDSPQFTVVHAADRYDYEKLPWWASVRFNVPLYGSYAREKYCLDMIPVLVENGYRSFAIPWGAAHGPVFGSMLVRNGFEEVAGGSLIVFNSIDGVHSTGWVRRMNFKNTLYMILEAIFLLFGSFIGVFCLIMLSYIDVGY